MKRMVFIVALAIIAMFACTAFAEETPEQIELYAPGNVPFEYDAENEPTTVSEVEFMGSPLALPAESYTPYLMAFPVEDPVYTVVIFPGGGYFHMNSLELEGTAIAEKYNAAGISCFVVAYRISPNDYRGILADGQRAVRYVRYHAEDYGIDPDKIAVLGFSQGGHLSLMTAEHTDYVVTDPDYVPDEIDQVSSMPNACLLGYPVVTLEEGVTFEPGALIFANGDESLREIYSAETALPEDMCPVFIWLCADDTLVPPENSFRLAQACAVAGIPYELHLFETGGHGIGLAEGQDCAAWHDLSVKFIYRLNAAEEAPAE